MNVPIIPDIIFEGNKSFSGILDTSAPRVTLNPAVTVISITDDEGKYTNCFISSIASYSSLNITVSCIHVPDHRTPLNQI